MSRKRLLARGVTLIEMLLVLVIASAIIYAVLGYMQQRIQSARINKTSAQIQQILNAGLAYYIANGSWPSSITPLLNGYYLPVQTSGVFNNPYQQPYLALPAGPTGAPPPATPLVFFVMTAVQSPTPGVAYGNALAIAGQLPNSYTSSGSPTATQPPSNSVPCSAASTTCYVVSSVNIPGQNLNNATAVNFAGLFRQGTCVPAPSCPKDISGTPMVPQIIVAPVSMSGRNDPGSNNLYPISSFSAYATGTGTNKNPPMCDGSMTYIDCNLFGGTPAANAYWRVCAQIITQKGNVQTDGPANPSWASNVSIMAITRCAISGEPSGTPFNIYGD